MKKSISLFVITIAFIIFGGCARLVKSDVAVFHQMSEGMSPTKYAFFPLDYQINSLEYKSYQNLVRQQLVKYQYTEVSAAENPDVVIALTYGIDNGSEKTYSSPIIGQTGIASSTTTGTISTNGNSDTFSGNTTYYPQYGVVGSSTETITEYKRVLWLCIVDAKTIGTKDLRLLYEGSVKSAGTSSQLASVMPAMIKALFEEFPGKSGESRRESAFM